MLKTIACLASILVANISFAQLNGFEKNQGQIANERGDIQSDVKFRTKIGNAKVYFFNDHVSYYFEKTSKNNQRHQDFEALSYDELDRILEKDTTWFYRLDLEFVNGEASNVFGKHQHAYHANYFLAHCPNGIYDVPFYKELIYSNVYEGVDYRFLITAEGLKYDILARKGADLSQIQFKYNGHEGITINNNELVMQSPFGEISESLPASYLLNHSGSSFDVNEDNLNDESAVKVNMKYRLSEDGIVSFFSNESIDQTVLIDPQLIWSTYYNFDGSLSIGQEMDAAAGQLVNVGTTADNTMPTLDPGSSAYFQSSVNGTDHDLRILKFTTDGVLEWATFYGGSLDEQMRGGVEINPSNGDIFIAASSRSTNFPTQDMGGGAWYENTNPSSESQIVFLKFNSSGVRQWATYFNANISASVYDIALSATGELYAVGDNGTGNTITTQTKLGAYNQTLQSSNSLTDSDGIIISFNPSGVLQWSTYFGADNASAPTDVNESLRKIEITNNGNIYVAGLVDAASTILLSHGGFFDPGFHGGSTDFMIARFRTTGLLEWSSYLGGMGNEVNVYGLSSDANNNVYLSGVTSSGAYPTIDPGSGAYFDNTLNGSFSGVITKFNDATAMIWSTYYGASGIDFNTALDVSDNNRLYVSSYHDGTSGMPVMSKVNAYNEASGSGVNNGFIAQFDTTGTQEWGSYISSAGGLTQLESIVSYDGTCGDQVYVGGTQNVTGYPLVDPGSGAYQANYSGSGIGKLTISQFNDNLQNPDWTPPAAVCENSPAIGLAALIVGDPGGTWSGPGVTGNSFDPAGISDSALITYTLGSGQCIDSLQQTIYIDSLSQAPTTINASFASICPGQNATLTVNGGSLGTGADWYWYEGSCGNNFQGNGASLVVSPSVTTTYLVRGEGSCGNSSCTSITITVKTLSNAPTGVSNFTNPVCIGDSTYIAPIAGSLGTGAVWNYYEGSCGGTYLGSGDSLAVHPTVTTSYFVQAAGDCNTTICQSVTINTATPSTDPMGISATDTTICLGGFTTLSINGGSLGSNADWEWYSGSCGGTPEGTGATLAVTPTITTTYFARAEGDCANTVCVQLTIEVESASTTPISAMASNNPMCANDTTVLSVNGGSLGMGADWYWYTGGCGTTPIDTGAIVTVQPTANTTYFVRAENSCNVTACVQVTVTVAPAGDASWSSPGTICESMGPVDMDQFITGNTGGSWFGTNIAGSFFNPAGLSGQSVTLGYTQGTGTCIDTVQFVIAIANTVNASWTSPGNVCESNGTVDLNPLITGSTGGTWSGTGVTGNVFDPSGLSGPISITYDVGVAPSCTDQSTLQLTVITGPTTPSVSATDTTICEGDTTTLMASGSGSTVNYHVFDAANGGNLLGDTDLELIPNSTTTYYVQAEDHNGCFHGPTLVPFTVTVVPAPMANAGPDQTICEGQTTNLTASGGTDYLWSTMDNTASISVSPADDETYSVMVTDNATGCSASDDVLVTVINQSDVVANDDSETVSIDEETAIQILNNDTNGDPTTLNLLSGPSNGSATFSGSDMLYTSNPDFVGFDTVVYEVCHATCPNICASALVRIFVTSGLEAKPPTGFSPNGDGINETFVVLGLENYPEAELQVFNRWGELVYSAKNYANNWGGESNGSRTLGGEQVPDGTYFYILILGDQFDTINGHVEIKRQ